MKLLPTSICCALILASAAPASPPSGNMSQLEQLNRSNEATLQYIQRPPMPASTAQHQRAQQRWLQERQRRELLMLNNRARTNVNPGVPNTLQGIDLQRRFQQQQQYQLNQFRLQRGLPQR